MRLALVQVQILGCRVHNISSKFLQILSTPNLHRYTLHQQFFGEFFALAPWHLVAYIDDFLQNNLTIFHKIFCTCSLHSNIHMSPIAISSQNADQIVVRCKYKGAGCAIYSPNLFKYFAPAPCTPTPYINNFLENIFALPPNTLELTLMDFLDTFWQYSIE